MASVVSKTSVKVDELLGPLVVSAAFQTNGHLLITTRNGSILDAGAASAPVSVSSWDSTRNYSFGDVVAYIGRIWMYVSPTAAMNVVPVLNTDRWQGLGAINSSVWVENDSNFDGASLAASWSAITQLGTADAAPTTTVGEYEHGPRALRISLLTSSVLAVAQLDENIVHGGETVTVTVRAKLSATATGTTLAARLYQNDGTGRPVAGAAGVVTTNANEGALALTTSWATYTFKILAVNSKIRGLVEIRATTATAAATVFIDSIKVSRDTSPGLAAWPIGSIYMSVSPNNPNITFNGGVWAAWGSGQVPVGVATGTPAFATVEQTGGEINHVLLDTEMPNHVHSMNHTHTGTTSSDGSHDHALDRGSGTGTSTLAIPKSVSTIDTSTGAAIANDGVHSHTLNVSTLTGNTGSAGLNTAHNNLQPYITCYMWKRTA